MNGSSRQVELQAVDCKFDFIRILLWSEIGCCSQTRQQANMASKSKTGASTKKSKTAANVASKSKPQPNAANKVVEVGDEEKTSSAEEVKAAPPPESSTADTEQASEEDRGQPEQKKPTEEEAEAIAEQLVAEARKPIKKNDSQSSLAGSVTVRPCKLILLSVFCHRLLFLTFNVQRD